MDSQKALKVTRMTIGKRRVNFNASEFPVTFGRFRDHSTEGWGGLKHFCESPSSRKSLLVSGDAKRPARRAHDNFMPRISSQLWTFESSRIKSASIDQWILRFHDTFYFAVQ